MNVQQRHLVAWFDPTEGSIDTCWGWHFCSFEQAHEGAHLCKHGHFCEQENEDAEEA